MIPPSVFSAQQPPSPAASSPRFGCRMMAFMSESPLQQREESLRLDYLVKSPNSLKQQSRPQRPLQERLLNAMNSDDLAGHYRLNGNPDGWGYVAYSQAKQQPERQRGTQPAFQDSQFDEAAQRLLEKHPRVLLAHIRLKTAGTTSPENNHPFTHGPWSFMHNGSVFGALTPEIQSRIQTQYVPLLGDGPKGKTDSESAFYLLLGMLKAQYGSLSTQTIGVENIRHTFARMIQEVEALTPPKAVPIHSNPLQLSGEIQLRPSSNFVFTDGQALFAYRNGHNLYLGCRKLRNGQQEFILASEPVKPKSGKSNVLWAEIPERHILTLAPDSTGHLRPSLVPLSQA